MGRCSLRAEAGASLTASRCASYATEGFVRNRSPARHLRHAGEYALEELPVFACNFSRLEPRPGLPQLSDCPGAPALCQRPACDGEADLHDRMRLREAMLAWRGMGGGGGAD